MHRSGLLILFCLLAPLAAADGLCGFPGRDGIATISGQVNHWFASADGAEVPRGSRELPLAPGQGLQQQLSAGDLVLLIQMQGADIHAGNSDRYGNGLGGDQRGAGWLAMQAGQFEFLRVESVEGDKVRIRGDGPGGGVRFDYIQRQPVRRDAQGRARWQLVRVPQYDHATLSGPLGARPWDGRRGGVLALDVRGRLDLAGWRIDVSGTGFRGGAPLSLLGALGGTGDWRYGAPSARELAAGFGQHASKGEGIAGAPRWLIQDGAVSDTLPATTRSSLSDGYPEGSMGRGAPGNAGGGGNSLSLDNREPSGGGGGAGGRDGSAGQDAQGQPLGGQGGLGLAVDTPRLLPGGGGGAGTRRSGEGLAGAGGRGGGIVLLRTGTLVGPGELRTDGAAGVDGTAGGGGGGGGTLMVLGAFLEGGPISLSARGGPGGQGQAAGGQGGAGRLLAGGGIAFENPGFPASNRLQPGRLPGVAPAYQCRPAGMLLAGAVVEDNGRDGAVAHDGIRQRQEAGQAGWPVTVRERQSGAAVDQARTNQAGQFALSLAASEAGKDMILEVDVPSGWWPVLGSAPDLPLAPFAWQGGGQWAFQARAEYLQDGIVLSVVRLPELILPEERSVERGSTQMFLYRYLSGTRGQVRFRYRGELSDTADWQHAFFLDQDCDAGSEYVDREQTRWIDVEPDQPVCVRVRVQVPEGADGGSLQMNLVAENRLQQVPPAHTPPPLQARVSIRLADD